MASFIAADAVATGSLRVLLRDYLSEGPQISLLYMPARHLPARITAFIDFMTRLVPADPPWESALLPPAPAGRHPGRASR